MTAEQNIPVVLTPAEAEQIHNDCWRAALKKAGYKPKVSYHNTTPIYGAELSNAVKVARQQDAAVLAIMRSGTWSPSQVWDYGRSCGRNWLLTSVRRSISNLTHAGALVMTDIKVDGPYGRKESTWSSV